MDLDTIMDGADRFAAYVEELTRVVGCCCGASPDPPDLEGPSNATSSLALIHVMPFTKIWTVLRMCPRAENAALDSTSANLARFLPARGRRTYESPVHAVQVQNLRLEGRPVGPDHVQPRSVALTSAAPGASGTA
jgi:hypothetical protein